MFAVLFGVSCGERGGSDGELVVYCGRSRELVGPVLEAFEREAGVRVRVRYGRSAELAALLATEGERSPAHVFLAQDAGRSARWRTQRRAVRGCWSPDGGGWPE